MERAVRTPDGRTLAVEDAGDSAGRVVLVHGGSPNSRHLYGSSVADAAARGLRLVSLLGRPRARDAAGTGPDRRAARPRERNGSLPLTSTAVMRDDRSSTPAVDGELNGSS